MNKRKHVLNRNYRYVSEMQTSRILLITRFLRHETLLLIACLFAVLFITGYELRLLDSEIMIRKIETKVIPYDSFREYKISDDILEKAETKVSHLLKKRPELKKVPYVDRIGYLTYSMMARSYDLDKNGLLDEKTFFRGIGRIAATKGFQELYQYNFAVISDLKYFPVPKLENGNANVNFEDTWSDPRTYGGDQKHEGTDLMASNNQRGYFPIVSMTDGLVEKKGWLEQGGYRIGIRSTSGGYFYYAHLASYAPDLKEGDNVIAGQLLGFMGDSGYGSEGTIGQFDVHLHLGIYVNTDQGEMSINPYYILKILETNRLSYNNQ